MREQKIVASLSIASPGKMTLRERRQIAAWLREHAVQLQGYGYRYTTGRFRARYFSV
jgi:hypothetical protein